VTACAAARPPDFPRTTDFLVIGGGIIGLALALEVRRRFFGARVTLVEKEAGCGLHASGRNSGVLHAGFYYAADSLKARLARDGNRRLAAYCDERRLPINRCGKLVVARSPRELAGLDELVRRGRTNGVCVEMISAEDARRIEPRARTHERALFSPSTASVDPGAVMDSLARDARDSGVILLTGMAYLGRGPAGIRTTGGTISARFVINASGLYADRVARDFGFSQRHRILPFKGLYLAAEPGAPRFRTHVYPVPDLGMPFLGVHVTLTVDGHSKIGPTAMPAFWREHYEGVRNFRLAECASILAREAALLLRDDFGFRRLAVTELRKGRRASIVALAGALAEGIKLADFRRWARPGVRAQLVDVVTRKLEMDFRLENDDRSLHVLNAVSPAFTCALPFADYVVDRIARVAA
jgi:L-2-hydroxyglutarate oxidase LhgO